MGPWGVGLTGVSTVLRWVELGGGRWACMRWWEMAFRGCTNNGANQRRPSAPIKGPSPCAGLTRAAARWRQKGKEGAVVISSLHAPLWDSWGRFCLKRAGATESFRLEGALRYESLSVDVCHGKRNRLLVYVCCFSLALNACLRSRVYF